MHNVHNYGAVGDGASRPLSSIYATLEAAQVDYPFATDIAQELDWAAIQKAINLARRPHLAHAPDAYLVGERVYLPPGKYQVNAPLYIQDVFGLEVVGEGAATSLRWCGAADENVIILENANACCVRNLWIMFDSPCDTVVVLQRGANTSTWIPSACVFEDLRVGGFNSGMFRRGFSVNGQGPGGDQNNEIHRWKRVDVFGYTECAFHCSAGQGHSLVFEDCTMNGIHEAPYGVYCEYGAAFQWLRGSGGYHTAYDFFVANFVHHITIDGWNSEFSAGLLKVWEGANCNPTPITVRGCRFSSTLELPFIVCQSTGLLTICGNLVHSFAGHSAKIVSATFNECGTAVIVHTGNVYYAEPWIAETGAISMSVAGIAHDFGNLYRSPEGVWYSPRLTT